MTEEREDAKAVLDRVTLLEGLRAELATRGRAHRFDVAPIRKVAIRKGHDPVVTDIAVRFPREAARHPVANGNPPSLAEARVSALGESVIEVFSFGAEPESVGVEQMEMRLDGGYVIGGTVFNEASRATDAVVELLEGVFPNRRFWV